MSASAEAKSRMERILRLLAEIDEIKGDIREIYAEEKADGGDKTAMGAAISHIRKREKDREAYDAREAFMESYLNAFSASGTPVATREHTHARDPRAAETYPDNSSEPNRVDCRLTNDVGSAAATAGGEGDASSPSAATEVSSPSAAPSVGDPSGHPSTPSPDAVPATDGAREGAVSLNGQSGQEHGLETQGRNEPVSVASPPAGVDDGEGASVSSPSIPTYAPSPPAPPRPSDEDLAIPSFLRRGHPDCRFNDSQREPVQ